MHTIENIIVITRGGELYKVQMNPTSNPCKVGKEAHYYCIQSSCVFGNYNCSTIGHTKHLSDLILPMCASRVKNLYQRHLEVIMHDDMSYQK